MMPRLQPRELLVLARRTAQRVQKDALTPAKRLGLCIRLLHSDRPDPHLEALRLQLSHLPKDEQHYWIGTFYALLLPAAERRSKATYFTPPHLARSIVALACKNGFDIKKHTAIDPSAGGAAFLSTLASQMHKDGSGVSSIIKRLSGVELDSGLATLSEISHRRSARRDNQKADNCSRRKFTEARAKQAFRSCPCKSALRSNFTRRSVEERMGRRLSSWPHQ